MLFPVNYLVSQWEVLELAAEFTLLELPPILDNSVGNSIIFVT